MDIGEFCSKFARGLPADISYAAKFVSDLGLKHDSGE